MSDYTNLNLDRNKIEELITGFVQKEDNVNTIPNIIIKKLNPTNNQNRYTISFANKEFSVDFYFKKDNTTTLKPIQKPNVELAERFCEYVYDSIEYKNVENIVFTLKLEREQFDILLKYLGSLENVEMKNDKKEISHADIIHCKNAIGDKITLTYYNTTKKMMFQGRMMQLYVEVKCCLAPFYAYKSIEYTSSGNNIYNQEDEIDKRVKELLNSSYNDVPATIKNLIYDSVTQMVYQVPAKDYSVWSYPSLRALEGVLKDILKNEGVSLVKGFRVRIPNTQRYKPVFREIDNTKTYKLNTDISNIINIENANTKEILEKGYSYYHKHRHSLFHTQQQLLLTRILSTPEEAVEIIMKVCKFIDTYYKK